MNKIEMIQRICHNSVYSKNILCVGIVVSSYQEAKEFHKNFMNTYEELPDWIRPSILRNTYKRIEFENMIIKLLYSPTCFRGLAFSVVFNELNVKHKNEEFSAFLTIHKLTGGIIIEYTDK